MQQTEPTPWRNRVKCKACGDILESVHQHDFKWCSCKKVCIDGGTTCPRYGYEHIDMICRVLDDGTECECNLAWSLGEPEGNYGTTLLARTNEVPMVPREEKVALLMDEIKMAVESLEKDVTDMKYLTAYDGLRLGYILQKVVELL